MSTKVRGATANNLKSVDADFSDGITSVTGVSGSGKSSLVFDTLYHEARRRFVDAFGTTSAVGSIAPAPVERIEGLGPAVAVDQNRLNRNPGSTVTTASGIHPFLRILYARFGTRSCPRCGAPVRFTSQTALRTRLASLEDIDTQEIVLWAIAARSAPGSHRTLINLLIERFGVDSIRVDGEHVSIDNPPDASSTHDIDVLIATFGPNSAQASSSADTIFERMAAIGANGVMLEFESGSHEYFSFSHACIACGYWLKELEPKHFNTADDEEAARTTWAGYPFAGLTELSVEDAHELFSKPPGPITERLETEILRRLGALEDVGLGYVGLDRSIPTLSRGEAQRLKIAISLVSPLEEMIHILDEPTVGQHPADIARFMPILRRLPGPVVFVEHDGDSALQADAMIDLGPGAGDDGGTVVFSGSPEDLLASDTTSGREFKRPVTLRVDDADRDGDPESYIEVRGASLRNLTGFDVKIPLSRMTVLAGVSGSGKSTLVEEVILPSLSEARPVGCDAFDSLKLTPVLIDQDPIGLNPRSNPGTYTKLADALRELFAGRSGNHRSLFTFNRPEGACPTCEGLGAREVKMRFLPSEWVSCPDCDGSRFNDSARDVTIAFGRREVSIDRVFESSVDELLDALIDEADTGAVRKVVRILSTLSRVGLGYLCIGQPAPTLSGGEAQRIKLAKYLSRAKLAGRLFILDEPSTGLHRADVAKIIDVLHDLVTAGATVLTVEHNLDVIVSADWLIELGPGAGPSGGELLYTGSVAGIIDRQIPTPTGRAIAEATRGHDASSIEDTPRKPRTASNTIDIRGARAHNLQSVDVSIPRGACTVVTGLSGSGKSSLVHDVLAVEARRRYLEMLSLYERQGVKERTGAEVDHLTGIGMTASFSTQRFRYAPRDDVARITGLDIDLSILFARIGERSCLNCGAAMHRTNRWRCDVCGETHAIDHPRHFMPGTYASTCRTCHGVGTVSRPAPEKLVINPDLPICAGALYSPGFFPKGYLCKPFNGGYDMVQALSQRYGFDPCETPWNEISEAGRDAFLFGDSDPFQVRCESRSGRVSVRTASFPGFYGWIGDWDVGGTYTDTLPCDACGGTRFRPEYLAVTIEGDHVADLRAGTLEALAVALCRIETEDQTARSALDRAERKLSYLRTVGLGYLGSNQVAYALSAGESQRLRLAGLLGSGLGSMTIILDEPTRGMHPCEVEGMIGILSDLRSEGNTVVVVEHDRSVIRAADHMIELGPGSGATGGRIIYEGPPQSAPADTPTGRVLAGKNRLTGHPVTTADPARRIIIRGACGNNLRNIDVEVPRCAVTGVCGVSGSGKSSLIIDTLARALAPKKQTTSVAYEPIQPLPHSAIEGAPDACVVLDQSRAGAHAPVDALGLDAVFTRLYAEAAAEVGIPEAAFKRTCPDCGGTGVIKIDMGFLPPSREPCEACSGSGFPDIGDAVKLRGHSIRELLALTCEDVRSIWDDEHTVSRRLEAACSVGLGYLEMQQPMHSLSGGELQRLKIARHISKQAKTETLFVLDEPTVGLHQLDVAALADALSVLKGSGHTVLVVEHNPLLLAGCDWLIELGPGGGPHGGTLVYAGSPHDLVHRETPTSRYVSEVMQR